MTDFFIFIGQCVVAWLIADLIGGFVHWWLDRVARPRWQWVEDLVWAPNREHHTDPLAFTKNGFLTRNSTTFAAASAAALLWFIAFGPSVVLLVSYIGGLVQSEVHLRTHVKTTGWVKVMQQIGVIQSVPAHARHHKPPQNRNYCVLTDWCNPVLEHLDVWNRLERHFKLTQIEK